MQPIKEAAAEFLAGRRVAVTGVSRTAKDHGSNVVYKRMRERVRGRGRLWPRARDRGDRRRLPVHVRPDRRSRPQGHAHDPDPDRERPAPRLIGGELRAITPLVPPAAEHEVGVAITSNAGDLCVCVNADRDPVEVTVGVEAEVEGRLGQRGHQAGVPAGSASVRGRPEPLGRQADADEQPRDDRVRVPHVTCAQLVAAPDGPGHARDQLEDAAGDVGVGGEPSRAADRPLEVGDRAPAPAAELVAEEPEPAEPSGCRPRRCRPRRGPPRRRRATARARSSSVRRPARRRAPRGRGRAAGDVATRRRSPRRRGR